MNPYDDMPKSWIHPHTMIGIRLLVGSVLLCFATAVIFGLAFALSGGAQ